MYVLIFFVLLVLWILGFTLFHVANALIHLLLIAAVVALVVHLVRGRRAPV
ncbi:MAG TPA: lmo0937 family membrane protein [Terriglobales bacterium]|nr:lmo0937 family membrane protein [Terriglobales bacterium]